MTFLDHGKINETVGAWVEGCPFENLQCALESSYQYGNACEIDPKNK